jgi:hypothetical protein
MAGRGSLAGLLAYGDANAIVLEMAGEVLPVALSRCRATRTGGLRPRNFSGRRNDLAPRTHRRGAERAMCLS